jgi:hypothetical protein
MAQNVKMTQLRSRMLSGDSGGGSFFLGATLTAFTGASSSFAMSVSSALAPVSEVIGACDDADMVGCLLLHLSVDRCQYYLQRARIAELKNADFVTEG